MLYNKPNLVFLQDIKHLVTISHLLNKKSSQNNFLLYSMCISSFISPFLPLLVTVCFCFELMVSVVRVFFILSIGVILNYYVLILLYHSVTK